MFFVVGMRFQEFFSTFGGKSVVKTSSGVWFFFLPFKDSGVFC